MSAEMYEPGDPALRETADPNATVPTGMCGSATKCARCPSDFLCYMKASEERTLINARRAAASGEGSDDGQA